MAYLTISDDFLSTHTTYSYRIVPNAMLGDNLITALEEECIQRLDSQKGGKMQPWVKSLFGQAYGWFLGFGFIFKPIEHKGILINFVWVKRVKVFDSSWKSGSSINYQSWKPKSNIGIFMQVIVSQDLSLKGPKM